MSAARPAFSLVTQRLARARAARRSQRFDETYLASSSPIFGETFAIGLGCDSWKSRTSR